MLDMRVNNMHIYVHVPFCDSICSYCDFFRVKTTPQLIDKYIEALRKEINLFDIKNIKTIYFGGGTPSALSVNQIDELLSLFDGYLDSVEEYTFEANPENLDIEKLRILKKHGVNRISLGVQTLNDKLLVLLNRKHRSEDVLGIINLIHSVGIHNISIDMMYALPYQSVEEFTGHLETIVNWPITHVSIYSLTIEEHSEFARKHIDALDNELEGIMYEEGVRILEENGFIRYEVANFGRENYHSRHNLGYWNYDPYYGLGPGAVGFIDNVRYENTHNLVDYFDGKYRIEEEYTDFKEQMFEYIMVGLRKCEGISLQSYYDKFNVHLDEVYKDAIRKNINKGWLEINNGNLRATKDGMQFLHTVLIDFMSDD